MIFTMYRLLTGREWRSCSDRKCQFTISIAVPASSHTERPYFACIQSNIMKKEESTNTERCVAPGNVEYGVCLAAAPAIPMTACKPERDPRGSNRFPSASPPRLYVHLIAADASTPAARIAGASGDVSGGGGCGSLPRDFPGA